MTGAESALLVWLGAYAAIALAVTLVTAFLCGVWRVGRYSESLALVVGAFWPLVLPVFALIELLEWVQKQGAKFAPTVAPAGPDLATIRAVLEAIREPTEAQSEALSATGKMWREMDSATVWRTYIDAALSEPPRPDATGTDRGRDEP